jgi:hypothetical protein
MPTLPDLICAELANSGHPHHALELALAAALRAGQDALPDARGRPKGEQFAVALQAAVDVLDGLALELAGDVTTDAAGAVRL